MLLNDIDEVLQRAQGVLPAPGTKILVTGARGFLGRAFTRVLAHHGCKVTAVDRYALAAQMGAAQPERLQNVEHIDFDLTRDNGIMLMGRRPEIILSLAGIASPVHYKRFPLETFDVCVKGTRMMLEIAQATGATVLYSSSSEVYANPEVCPTPEYYVGRVPTMGERSPYDVSKLAGETLCKVFSTFGVKTRIVRYFNVYGPGLSAGDYRVMSRFARAVLNDQDLTVYGVGGQTRTFCYLTDAVIGTLTVLARGDSSPYNVGNEKPEVSMTGLAETFERYRPGGPRSVVHAEPPPEYVNEPQRRCPELSRIRALGYEPKVSLGEGIRRFLAWAGSTGGYRNVT